MALNLTDALRSFAPMPHTDPTDLTDFFFLMALNLTELGRKVVGHVRVLRVLRVLRFPKLTQIQRDSTKI